MVNIGCICGLQFFFADGNKNIKCVLSHHAKAPVSPALGYTSFKISYVTMLSATCEG